MLANTQIIENIPQLALQEVLQNQIDEVDGSTIYSVLETWQAGELQKHPDIKTVRDVKALEEAVASPEHPIIFIPTDAQITQGIAYSILQRNPLNKHILWEAQRKAA